jgi:D-beta-D-heptose 7-phosphate kinase / D-beta-D-heptose 1-phosphate adenosyltransferase
LGVEDRLLQVLDRFGRQRILLVGDIMLDRYVYGDAERISPESPVPVLRVVKQEQRLGGAGSVAANLAAFGAARVALFGATGQDEAGRQVMAMMADLGIDAAGIVQIPDRPTICKTRVIGLAQRRHRQQMLRIDEEAAGPLSADVLAGLHDRLLAGVASGAFDAILVEDYNKGVVTQAFVQRLTAQARSAKIPVLVDPAAIDDYSRYHGATLITPNRAELLKACGKRVEGLEAIGQEAEALRVRLGLDWVVATLDKEGSLLVGPDSVEHASSRPRDVYDNTGAGDAVLAMLGMAMSVGASPLEAVHLANVAGGLEVEKFGATPVRWDEVVGDLMNELRKRGRKIVDEPRLEILLARHRRTGKKVVFTNGCFDLLHVGHVDLLRFCKENGDIVVVGLNSDKSVQINKGPSRPVLKEQERAHLLEAIEYVDYVVLFETEDPHKLIERVRPDYLVKGQDYTGKWVCGQEFVESYGGRVLLAPLRTGYSTTNVIRRIEVSNGQGQGGGAGPLM